MFVLIFQRLFEEKIGLDFFVYFFAIRRRLNKYYISHLKATNHARYSDKSSTRIHKPYDDDFVLVSVCLCFSKFVFSTICGGTWDSVVVKALCY
jgi:hypothetical protein